MKKIFHTLLVITFICFNNIIYGMENSAGVIRIPKQIDNDERSPLHSAACKGDIITMKSLLNEGADVNQADHAGITSLHFASWYGHTEIVQLLCDYGANVNQTDTTGRTPLFIASFWKRDEIIKLLINAGALNKASEDEKTAALWERVGTQIVKFLQPQLDHKK